MVNRYEHELDKSPNEMMQSSDELQSPYGRGNKVRTAESRITLSEKYS